MKHSKKALLGTVEDERALEAPELQPSHRTNTGLHVVPLNQSQAELTAVGTVSIKHKSFPIVFPLCERL